MIVFQSFVSSCCLEWLSAPIIWVVHKNFKRDKLHNKRLFHHCKLFDKICISIIESWFYSSAFSMPSFQSITETVSLQIVGGISESYLWCPRFPWPSSNCSSKQCLFFLTIPPRNIGYDFSIEVSPPSKGRYPFRKARKKICKTL